MITCKEALELLSAQLDGAITIEEQAALDAHLASCPECRRIQNELRLADEALPGLQQEPPQLLHDAVMQKIRRETRQKKERKPLLRFVGVMAAVAALLAVLAGFHLIRLPGFDSGEASVSMGDTLFPRAQSAKEYAEQLARQTGCRVILVEHCAPEDTARYVYKARSRRVPQGADGSGAGRAGSRHRQRIRHNHLRCERRGR